MEAKLALIDTNLFLLWLVGLRDTSYIGTHKRTNKFSISDFENLREFLGQMDRVTTTSHVMAEVANLLAQTDEDKRLQLGVTFQTVLKTISEHHQLALVLADDLHFMRLGLTDSGLLHESLKMYILITDDGPLHTSACALGHPCIHFNEIRDF